ncbi:MAG TPA: L,D-transpeptidase family protein [Beijerinckiaceae bacterium]|jgi:murein L,D-transpeptidase YcbB/YkuD
MRFRSTAWLMPALLLAVPALAAGNEGKTLAELIGPPAGETAPVGPATPVPAPPSPAAATTPAAPETQTGASKKASAPIRYAAVSDDPRPALDPGTFIHTMRAAEAYQVIAEGGGWPTLPPGVLKAGDQGPAVAALKQRLGLTGDLSAEALPGDRFDAAVAGAVRRFQARHGLPETGVVRERTLQALNVPAETRARQLVASAQRLVGSRFPFGERYVVVNIPSATVEAVEGGAVRRRYVAVVGKKDRPSPTLMARITDVNFNPTWTVPVSLIKKDIIPHVRKDPAYLAKMKIRLLDGKGQEVDPAKIDWSTDKAANYTVRQDPGAINSLGQVRIDMPNRHAVYLHDTPSKKLFAQDARFHSSGCVRVGDVRAFAEWLLAGTGTPTGGAWGTAEIEASIATGQRQDVKLAKPVPVAWVYLTGYALPDGTVQFRDDVYGLDREPPPAPAPAKDFVTSSIKPKTPAAPAPLPASSPGSDRAAPKDRAAATSPPARL